MSSDAFIEEDNLSHASKMPFCFFPLISHICTSITVIKYVLLTTIYDLICRSLPLNLKAEVTLVTVPFETPASWADLWLKLLTTMNKFNFFPILIQNQKQLGLLSIFIHSVPKSLIRLWLRVPCSAPVWKHLHSLCFSFIQVFPSLSDSGKYDLGLRMATCVFCVCLWCLLFVCFFYGVLGVVWKESKQYICWQKSKSQVR